MAVCHSMKIIMNISILVVIREYYQLSPYLHQLRSPEELALHAGWSLGLWLQGWSLISDSVPNHAWPNKHTASLEHQPLQPVNSASVLYLYRHETPSELYGGLLRILALTIPAEWIQVTRLSFFIREAGNSRADFITLATWGTIKKTG